MKKALLVFMCAALAVCSGCSAIIEGEYQASSDHVASFPQSSMEAEMWAEVSTYGELYSAVSSFVDEGIEYGIVRFDSYSGDMESDLSEICLAVASETPLGAYAVYYINYSLNKIVSYYEADISVMYKKTQEEIGQIITVEGAEDIKEQARQMLENRKSSAVFYIEQYQQVKELFTDAMDGAYYDNPGTILYYPTWTMNIYPESGLNHIVELRLSFPYTASTSAERLAETNETAQKAADGLVADSVQETVENICGFLHDTVEFDQDRANSDSYSRWYNSYTAYGALVLNKAVGEGYAMAMKLICDKLGIECVVVRGRLNNVSHAWNLITLENGQCYHVDSSAYEPGAGVFFNDSEMQDEYWWEQSDYPESTGDDFTEEPVQPQTGDEPAGGQPQTQPSGGGTGQTGGETPPAEEPVVDDPEEPETGGEPEQPEDPGQQDPTEPVEDDGNS